ncbi:MAG: ankyrin repeat domain-containing protein, partial [Rickettsiales bacterium]
SQGHTDIIEEILKNGNARELLLAKNNDGNTPLHLAVSQGHPDIIEEILKNGNARELLLAKNNDGNTPLHLAAKNGNILVVNAMLDAARKMGVGAQAELLLAPNSNGDTPLHLAAAVPATFKKMRSTSTPEEDAVIEYAFFNLKDNTGKAAALTLINPSMPTDSQKQSFESLRATYEMDVGNNIEALRDALEFYKEIHQTFLPSGKTAVEVCEDHLKIAMQKHFPLTTTLIQNHLTFIGLDENAKNEVIQRCKKSNTEPPKEPASFSEIVPVKIARGHTGMERGGGK